MMRHCLFIVISLYLISAQIIKAQDFKDKPIDKPVKTGWDYGLIPAIAFDADQGFQYGAAVNFYYYGDGKGFPNYKHSLYFELSRYTNGSGVYRFYYDSEHLIPGIQITTDLSYLPDQAYSFYGFNGYESVYHKSWEDQNSPDYRTRMFYKFQQNLFRFKTDFQGNIADSRFRWIAGFNLLDFRISSVDINKLNKGKSGANKLPPVSEQPGLYEKYRQWGLIDPAEADGGFIPELKGGIVYDTRDNKPNPMKGMWSEAVIACVPEFLGAETGFSKISLTHRQYFTLIKEDLSFAYRLGWQQTLEGHVPFYYQSQIITSVMTGSTSTGLGGSKSLRGILRNRIVGDGFAYGNFELRWKFARMKLFKQNCYWGLNGFMDIGQVTKKIDLGNKLNSIQQPITDYFNIGAEKLHKSVGGGLRLAINYNFIIAVDYGVALNKQDGDTGMYIGLNYLF